MTSFCSSFPEVSLPSNRSNHYFASVLPHLSELMSKIEMQLGIRRTDQSKPFPVIVLLQCARLFYALHCAILGCFVQIRTASVVQTAEHVLRKFRPSPGKQGAGPASL